VALLGVVAVSGSANFTTYDKELIQVALNLEYLEADYFLWGAYGYGLDVIAPYLTGGGPNPIGAQKANLNPYFTDVYQQMGLQEVGHLRAIKTALGPKYAFSRPLLDLSKANWAKTIDKAFNKTLNPPFDPYANSLNYLISTYAIPYVGLTGYVGANPLLTGEGAKSLVAGLLGVEAGQDAIIRTEMYRIKNERVSPYKYTVADFSIAISNLRNNLSHVFVDEGLVVPIYLGAENKTTGNILSADANSLAYARTGAEVLETVYGTGNPAEPGGFYPHGGKGVIADKYLDMDKY
jgi:hypothetical protein